MNDDKTYPGPVPDAPRFKLHAADANRKKRRALINAVGKRQFKKMYRGAKE